MDEQTYGQTYMTEYSTQPQQQPIESASGTTSPENGSSGPFAYILTAVCLVAVIMLSVAISGCIGDIFSMAIDYADITFDRVENQTMTEEELERYFDDNFDGDSFEDYFNEIFGDTYGDIYGNPFGNRTRNRKTEDTPESYAPLDVLGLGLSLYGDTVNDLVSANAYAGADSKVKEAVRELLLSDRDATEQIIHELRAAGRDGEDFDERLGKAQDIASYMQEQLDAYELPKADDEAEGFMDSALEHLKARWTAIGELLDMLANEEEIDSQDLLDADTAIYNETIEAAEAFEGALVASID